MKSYEFSYKGLEQLKHENQKEKINNISNIVFYSIITIFLIQGVIGVKFLINYVACSSTSKFVKWIIK